MEFTERVLVLQIGKFREADLWVRFLSPSRGLLSAFAFGGSRSRKRFVGCLDLFNEINVRVSGSARNPYLALQEGVLIRGVTRLRHDWSRFGLAVNCARFLQSFGVGREGAAESHFLMRQTLLLLEEEEAPPLFLPLFFRLRLAFDQGYALGTDRCSECGSAPEAAWLLLRQGRIACGRCCGPLREQRLPLGPAALAAMRGVRTLPPEDWTRLGLSGVEARQFARAADGFIQYHVGIAWERGRFTRR